MLPTDRLTLAIDIQYRSHELLRCVTGAVDTRRSPVTRAHDRGDATHSVLDWLEQHYLNFPPEMLPERRFFPEFANFFSTYVTSTYDVVERPGERAHGHCGCGCFCPWCAYYVNAPRLRPKKITKPDKNRARELMIDRATALALEEDIDCPHEHVVRIVESEETRRHAGYSAYGHWLIKRLDGHSDGNSILALWREIAWKREGSPIPGFRLRYGDFVAAEEALVDALRTAVL